MDNNPLLRISVAGSRKATIWQATQMRWSEFLDKLKTPVRSAETYEEYIKLPKARQDELKDVGGFVGGTFKGNRRKAANVEGRCLITLDLDNIPAGKTEDIIKRVSGLNCSAAVYSTRKHCGYAPRLRVIMPLNRTCTADEYEPIARKMAAFIGIEFCDPTTFEASRLMYWPSVCSDGEYICETFIAEDLSVDGVLDLYDDWHDVTSWPQVPGIDNIQKRRVAKQEDPLTKQGLIGAFCRTYTITAAMDKFIPGMYEPTVDPNRFTFAEGSTVGGAVLYDDDKFLFSHHATDPCSGQLVNSFDMVRLHMYGDLDDEAKEGTPNNKLPSFKKMEELAGSDPDVSALLAKERHDTAVEAFAEDNKPGEAPEDDLEWMQKLEATQTGYKKSVNNLIIILDNDPLIKGKIAIDVFANRGVALGALPWDPDQDTRMWTDTDDAGIYWYIEHHYNCATRDKLDDALTIVASRHKINEVVDYLKSLTWDNVCRIDRLLTDYLGAEYSEYTAAVMRKSLCAAVSRALDGGVKYDYMPILTGPQGIGKSTFLSNLGLKWFSDSLTTFEGKEAAELIQGQWIVEVGELTAMNKQESNAVKQFLSKKEDIYRAAYGRRTERYPRRCVFFGTSNDQEYLKDSTGNRRFWPVDVGVQAPVKSVWDDMPKEVDQIWAEAMALWSIGEPLYMSGNLDTAAKEAQDEHRHMSEKEGIIRDFLERKVPSNWHDLTIGQRRQYWQGNLQLPEGTELVERDRVCAAEVWTECLDGNPKFIKKQDSIEVNSIIEQIPGWIRMKSTGRFGVYGVQRGFTKEIKQKI